MVLILVVILVNGLLIIILVMFIIGLNCWLRLLNVLVGVLVRLFVVGLLFINRGIRMIRRLLVFLNEILRL